MPTRANSSKDRPAARPPSVPRLARLKNSRSEVPWRGVRRLRRPGRLGAREGLLAGVQIRETIEEGWPIPVPRGLKLAKHGLARSIRDDGNTPGVLSVVICWPAAAAEARGDP